jgi:two-component system, cell cycle sensor histidine kinase and response regulator CckA
MIVRASGDAKGADASPAQRLRHPTQARRVALLERHQGASMTPATIMLVEDNPYTRKMVRFALEKRGHSVLEAADGTTALSMLEARSVDLILQDLVLPDIDGFDLVTRLRALPHGGIASILAFSGLLSKLEEARVATLGFDDLVVKPIEPSRLIPLIEAHLLGPTARDRIGNERRLILADDDPLQLKLTRFRLERLGFVVESVVDGQLALEAAKRRRPDGIVSDILMPRLDGFGLALAVRTDPALSGVPVLLVTSSYIDDSDRELARSVGANDLIVRTPDQRELTQALRIMLHERPPLLGATAERPLQVERERSGRVVHQLERQVTLNSGLAHRCSTLAAELAVLSGISEAVVKHQNVEHALDETLAACLDVGGIAAGALYLARPNEASQVRPLHGSGNIPGLASFFGNDAALQEVIMGGRVALVPSGSFASEWSTEVLRLCEATFAFVVPLLGRDGPVGAFFVAVRAHEADQEDWRVFVQGLGNQISQAMSLARTFSEKEAAEHHAHEQALFLQMILDSIGDAVIATDSEGKVLRVNRVASDLTGWGPEEAVGRHVDDLFRLRDERTLAPLAGPLGPALRELRKGHDAGHALLVSRSGREYPVAAGGAPIRESSGRVRGGVIVFRDITEARAAELALRESEERFRSTFEQAAVGMAHVAPDGRWLDVNQRLCEILGYTRSELLTQKFQDTTFPDDVSGDLHNMAQVLSGERSTFSLEKRCVRRDGEIVWVDVTTSLVRDGDRAPAYFISVVQDISLRKRTEEELEQTASQLRQSQKMDAIGQLAGGIAHDFNNLLSIIGGHSELLLEELDIGDVARPEVEAIAQASERASNLTRQLLAVGRKQVIAPRITDINETTDGLSKMLRRLIGENIELKLVLGAVGHVFVDPGQIEQVLINLVVNARDAMPRGGVLTIETSDAAPAQGLHGVTPSTGVCPSVMLRVTDTGAGMSPEVLARAFEPFFTTKELGRGTGLGLSTVFGIVKQSNGDILVSSEPGKGSTFRVYLPTAEGTVRVSHPPRLSSSARRGTETVLLVEDEGAVRAVAKAILSKAGYRVIEAASGALALEACERFGATIDLLLTDVVMPHMNGRELAERVSALRPTIKVIFMSGYTDDAIVHHGVLNAGMAFVQKPLTVDLLLGKLREVLDAPAGCPDL